MNLPVIIFYAAAVIVPLIITFIYMLPAGIALRKKHRSLGKIMLLNVFLGWTAFIWVVVFIWSLYSPGDKSESSA